MLTESWRGNLQEGDAYQTGHLLGNEEWKTRDGRAGQVRLGLGGAAGPGEDGRHSVQEPTPFHGVPTRLVRQNLRGEGCPFIRGWVNLEIRLSCLHGLIYHGFISICTGHLIKNY